MTNFQKSTSNLSPKLKFPFLGGGGCWIQLPTFDAESRSAKTPKSHYGRGVGGVGDQFSKVNFKLSNLSPKLKFPFLGEGEVLDPISYF